MINKSLLSAFSTHTFLEQTTVREGQSCPESRSVGIVKFRWKTGYKGAKQLDIVETWALESGCVQVLPL